MTEPQNLEGKANHENMKRDKIYFLLSRLLFVPDTLKQVLPVPASYLLWGFRQIAVIRDRIDSPVVIPKAGL